MYCPCFRSLTMSWASISLVCECGYDAFPKKLYCAATCDYSQSKNPLCIVKLQIRWIIYHTPKSNQRNQKLDSHYTCWCMYLCIGIRQNASLSKLFFRFCHVELQSLKVYETFKKSFPTWTTLLLISCCLKFCFHVCSTVLCLNTAFTT